MNLIPQFKGWIGEKKTSFLLWCFLSSKNYLKYHDLIIPSNNGTTQLDHLIISKFGLFIVETKNKTGWIFGNEHNRKWTQVIFNNKYKFQNPLYQIYRQKKVLSQFLDLNENKIHTIVYFVGNCTFKTSLPKNVLNFGLVSFLKSYNQNIISQEEINSITNKIKQLKSKKKFSKRDHIKSLKQRHESNTICPNCGGILLLKTSKKGRSIGSRFYGCINFPKCRFSRNL